MDSRWRRTYGSTEEYDEEGSFPLVYPSFVNDLSFFPIAKTIDFMNQKEVLFETLEGHLANHQNTLKDREKALTTAKGKLINDSQKAIRDRDPK